MIEHCTPLNGVRIVQKQLNKLLFDLLVCIKMGKMNKMCM